MITVKLFALLKEKAGCDELRIKMDTGTVSNLLKQVAQEFPSLSDMISRGSILVSVNHELAHQDSLVKNGDEVALMPPFSGGSAHRGAVRIQQEPFSIEKEVEALKRSSDSIGAVVMFLGTTRDITREKQVAKLEFEHYPEMAERKLAEIRERAISDFGVIDIRIIHRVGTIPVGENIVLIIVASRHREEAFTACRFCIDELKRITPIWKKETTPEGEIWVEEHP